MIKSNAIILKKKERIRYVGIDSDKSKALKRMTSHASLLSMSGNSYRR